MTSNQKLVHLEFLRIVACFMVIANHTWTSICRGHGLSFSWFVGIVYFYITKIAVPLFVMIMGAVLLPKTDSLEKTKMRLFRGVGVLVAASAIYYIYYGMKYGGDLSVLGFCKTIVKSNATNAFWYLYLYLGILCLLPILQKAVKVLDKTDLQWIIFLSVGVLGTVPVISVFIPSFGISSYFSGVLFSPFLGLLLCGYYIERYVTVDRTKCWVSVFLFILLVVFQTMATYYFYCKDPNNSLLNEPDYYLLLDSPNYITITSAAVCFYIIVKYWFSRFQVGSKISNAFLYLGGLTFGIYLLSDLIINLTQPFFDRLNGRIHVIPAVGLWEIMIFCICAIIIAGVKRIPYLNKWI